MKTSPVPAVNPVILSPGEGPVLEVLGNRLAVQFAAAETAGTFTLFEATVPPGGGVPPHFHLHEDEFFLVREGSLNVLLEDRWTVVEAGGVVFIPRGHIHAHRNDAAAPCRFWLLTTPAGLESCFARLARETATPEACAAPPLALLCAQHGLHFLVAGESTGGRMPPEQASAGQGLAAGLRSRTR